MLAALQLLQANNLRLYDWHILASNMASGLATAVRGLKFARISILCLQAYPAWLTIHTRAESFQMTERQTQVGGKKTEKEVKWIF